MVGVVSSLGRQLQKIPKIVIFFVSIHSYVSINFLGLVNDISIDNGVFVVRQLEVQVKIC